jgi:hypothetical protein
LQLHACPASFYGLLRQDVNNFQEEGASLAKIAECRAFGQPKIVNLTANPQQIDPKLLQSLIIATNVQLAQLLQSITS